MDRIERRCLFVGKVIVWTLVFILNTGLCIPGIVISLQYKNDTCVTKTSNWNVFLDWWLLASAIFQFAIAFMTLPCVCFHFEKVQAFRTFIIITDIIIGLSTALGIFLVAKSDLGSCQHDSLWVMSIVFIVTILLWITFQIVYGIIKCINNRQSSTPLYGPLSTNSNQTDIEALFFSGDEDTSAL